MDSIAATQPGIAELLQTAGAVRRGNRHDCPKCSGQRTVTHTVECFYCHGCAWKGNITTLAKELGIYQPIPAAQYWELCRKRERAHEAATRLCAVAHARQLELRADLRLLGRREQAAHEAGPREAAWDSLALVYAEQPGIEVGLNFLESASAANLIQFLAGRKAP